MTSQRIPSHLGERPTVVIDKLPPRELTIEQPAIAPGERPKPRWSRSQKGVLWTLGVAIYGLTLTNMLAWESKENKDQLREVEQTVISRQQTTTTSKPDLPSTIITPLDFAPVTATSSLPEISTTTTTAPVPQVSGIDLPDTSSTSTTTTTITIGNP